MNYVSLSILQDILIKYSFFSIFFLFLTTTILKHTRALSLSLLILQITSLSLSLKNYRVSLSFSFFTGSFFHWPI